MSTRLLIINTSARTGILKPSLRTISIASVPLLIAENYLIYHGNATAHRMIHTRFLSERVAQFISGMRSSRIHDDLSNFVMVDE